MQQEFRPQKSFTRNYLEWVKLTRQAYVEYQTLINARTAYYARRSDRSMGTIEELVQKDPLVSRAFDKVQEYQRMASLYSAGVGLESRIGRPLDPDEGADQMQLGRRPAEALGKERG